MCSCVILYYCDANFIKEEKNPNVVGGATIVLSTIEVWKPSHERYAV